MAEPDAVEPLRADTLGAIPHGFLTRRGGVSRPPVAGLQFGTGAGDDPAAVAENRRRAVAAILPGAGLAMPYQVHSPDAVVVDRALSGEDRPRADALVTATPGLLLGIVTADCAPVLLADAQAGVVGAAHAGWRGAVGGVVANTIAAMEGLGARRESIRAAVGPCIAQASYEVGPGMRDDFPQAARRFFAPGEGDRWQFDLAGYVADRLAEAGVGGVEVVARDTYGEAGSFYSYRRATHLKEAHYGRHASLIGLPPA